MAGPTPAPKPGRSLAIIAAVLILMYAGMLLLQGTKPTPKLGLDLQGGTSVTLTARLPEGENGQITKSAMDQAKQIIEDRVNGTGVAEAEVAVQGNKNIVVNIPGDELKTDLLSTALLRFRPVLQVGQAAPAQQSPSGTPSGSPSPSATPSGSSSPSPSPSTSDNGRAVSGALLGQQSSPSPTPAPTPGAGGQGQGSTQITPAIQKQFNELDCTKSAEERQGKIEPADQLLVTCDSDGFKYILGPTAVEGTHLNGADAGLPGSGVGSWQVNLSFDGTGTKQFAQTTKDLVGQQSPQNQFAIVLDGQVVSAPVVQSEIPTGRAEITGNFSQSEAKDLANVLKYGALPLAFDQSELNEISPTLGSDYLRVGIIAGALGLALVALYLLIYYRGLGLVAIASLVMAGLLTYASVVLLGEWIGFTLTLAGIAGLIVAVGITADSFVVFFERLRDEVREGRSLRAAVEHGWRRARRTILVADFVSFLAAAVLYILSIGSVRGFAFALGLTTVIDVVVVFFFTKPLIALLARTEFYGGGHRWSGLDPDRLGARRRLPTGEPQTIVGRRSAAEEV
ncbi:MAG TPA: protein translocase subunit SecD [Actinomycetes bacterium]|nr:protein translocase subunit SecD [Actinomycetes bacterium]